MQYNEDNGSGDIDDGHCTGCLLTEKMEEAGIDAIRHDDPPGPDITLVTSSGSNSAFDMEEDVGREIHAGGDVHHCHDSNSNNNNSNNNNNNENRSHANSSGNHGKNINNNSSNNNDMISTATTTTATTISGKNFSRSNSPSESLPVSRSAKREQRQQQESDQVQSSGCDTTAHNNNNNNNNVTRNAFATAARYVDPHAKVGSASVSTVGSSSVDNTSAAAGAVDATSRKTTLTLTHPGSLDANLGYVLPSSPQGSPLIAVPRPLSAASRSGLLPTYKMLVVGDAAVGKTNLLGRYCTGKYDPNALTTIGVEFFSREVEIPTGHVGQTETVVLQLWDTAGQERSSTISNAFYRNAVGALLVYDVTRRQTLLNVLQWAAHVRATACEDCVCVVVGNKADVAEAEHTVTVEEAEMIAHSLGMRHFLVSACNGNGVGHAFTQIVLAINAVQSVKAAATADQSRINSSASPTGAYTHQQQQLGRAASQYAMREGEKLFGLRTASFSSIGSGGGSGPLMANDKTVHKRVQAKVLDLRGFGSTLEGDVGSGGGAEASSLAGGCAC